MVRYLTGIQSSGEPHLGNILGAIEPAMKRGRSAGAKPFYFIADLHSLTTIADASERLENTISVAAAWMAFGCQPENTTLYRQSAIARVTELSWYLSCFTPVGLLRRSHAFKEKSKVGDPKAGLMFYPVLMAADILLYDATHVPVGKDQQEHLDITRDVGRAFNHRYGDAFVIPEAVVSNSAIVPGTDGKKMSKSRRNRINVFHSDDELRNAVMSIKTDSLGLRDPKSPDKCTVFRLFELVADHNAVEQMRIDYGAGAIGYGDAKQLLFEAIQKRYSEPRDRYHELVSSKAMILEILDHGEQVANRIANNKMEKVRSLLGF